MRDATVIGERTPPSKGGVGRPTLQLSSDARRLTP
jgi:hypothetical protein